MLTTLSYLEAHGWHPTRASRASRFIHGLCPLHQERRPSFMIDTTDWHWWCHAEQQGGTLIGMINELEFRGVHRTEIWNQCYIRARELNGGPLPLDDPRFAQHYTPKEHPVANEEQQAVLTTAMRWWHEQLWNMRSPFSARGRSYFERRGVQLSALRDDVQLGYAPPFSYQHYNQFFASFSSAMRHSVGSDWQQPAKALGLLWEKSGTMAVQDRIVFCSVNAQGKCVFYQGRAVELPGDRPHDPKRRFYKYMSPWGIKKQPFSLPIATPIIEGTVHVESPVGPAILAGYGIRAAAHEGNVPDGLLLKQFPGPHYIATDHDVAHMRKDGSVFYPGENQAQKLITVCQQENLDYQRLLPPLKEKDVDTWVKRHGIAPLLAAMHDGLSTTRCA